MKYIVFFLFLVLIATIIFLAIKLIDKNEPDGLLNVDTRDPDKDYYDFVFLIPTVDIPKKKYLKIEVKTKS